MAFYFAFSLMPTQALGHCVLLSRLLLNNENTRTYSCYVFTSTPRGRTTHTTEQAKERTKPVQASGDFAQQKFVPWGVETSMVAEGLRIVRRL